MEEREKPWNRVFHIVEKENCVYNKSLWIFVKEKNVRIWIGYRKRHIREQRNKEWSRAMVRWSADDIIYEDEQILVCRKHSGMAVQSARVGQMDLESELRNYWKLYWDCTTAGSAGRGRSGFRKDAAGYGMVK